VPISTVDIEAPVGIAELEMSCEVRAILWRAPETIARALFLIYFGGEKVAAAARAVGMSRFALSRQITSFMRTVREASAA
jgi:hypothetical protein